MLGTKKKTRDAELMEKLLDVTASMQGNLSFKDPVNLRINGRFEGNLDTKGTLMIGEKAQIDAKIKGDVVVVAGKVTGDIEALKSLKLIPPACVIGNIHTPSLTIQEGAILHGNSKMLATDSGMGELMTAEEIARYLEVDTATISEWVKNGKIPAIKQDDSWRFQKKAIDDWIASEKLK